LACERQIVKGLKQLLFKKDDFNLSFKEAVMQLNKDSNDFFSNMKEIIDFFGKCIPVVIFLSTFFGANLMFSFSKDHAINFMDLLQSNVIIALGTISAFLVSVLAFSVIAIMLITHLQARYIVQSFIQRSRINWVRRKRNSAVIIMCIFNCLWGAIFLIKSDFYVLLLLAVYATLIFCYVLFLTKNTMKFILTRKHIFHSFCCLALTITPAFLCFIATMLIVSFFERDLKGVSVIIGVILMMCVYFFLTLLPLLLCFKKEIHQKTPLLCGFIFFGVLFLFLFSFSSSVSEKVVNITGIGLKKVCYLKGEVVESNVPDALMKEHKNSYELNVLAELNDVFYLTSEINGPAIAAFRFKSDNLKSIGCPSLSDNKVLDGKLI